MNFCRYFCEWDRRDFFLYGDVLRFLQDYSNLNKVEGLFLKSQLVEKCFCSSLFTTVGKRELASFRRQLL